LPFDLVRTLKLTVAYDGTRFVGWQRQAEGESIQGLIEEALTRVEGAPVTVHGAGRTDAGVHALGQVASVGVTCRHDTATLTRALNAHLPTDIRVLAIEEQDRGFHARFSARSKCYRYRIQTAAIASPFERAYAWHLPEPLDVDAMRAAASMLVGRHDFAAFQSAGGVTTETVRTMTRSELTQGGLLVYEICGNGFLRHMVRAITGTLVDVGRGRRAAAGMTALLQGGTRAQAGKTAPAHGLFLVGVDYD
jgi:tRNA pseudouridine38-40 synthase